MGSNILTVATMMIISAVAVGCQLVFSQQLSSLNLEALGEWAMLEVALSYSIGFCVFGGEATIVSIVAGRKKISFSEVVFAYITIGLVIFLVAVVVPVYVVFHLAFEVSTFNVLLVLMSLAALTISTIISISLRANQFYLLGSLLERAHWFFIVLYLATFVIFDPRDSIDIYRLLVFASAVVFVLASVTLAAFIFSEPIKFSSYIKSVFCIIKAKGALSLSASGMLIVLYDRFDQLILRALMGPEALGIYFACYKVAFAVKFMTKSVNQFFLPLIVKNSFSASGRSDSAMLANNLNIGSFLAFPIVVLIVMFSPQVLMFFDIQSSSADLALSLLAISGFWSIGNIVLFGYFSAHGGGRAFLANGFMTWILQVFIIFLLVPIYGIIALALAKVSSSWLGNFNAKRYAPEFGVSVSLLKNFLIGLSLVVLLYARRYVLG
jgi:O-antigen/teichoic acid export membrane protein